MTIIHVSAQERAEGHLSSSHLEEAVAAMHEDGFVQLNDAVNPEHIAVLREKMLADVEVVLSRPDAPFNFNTGNVQQGPPPHHPYLFEDVLLNNLVIDVTEAVLGPGLKNTFYSGNTALPGCTRQPVHPDIGQLWPGLEHSTPAFGLVVNVPVVATSAENGATELWPGTHHDTTYDIHRGAPRIPEEVLAPWRAKRPPLQPTIPIGGVVIRDMRLWHAGMPNHTQTPRPMIAMIHWCAWWCTGAVEFSSEAEEFLKHPRLKTDARFVEGEVNYLHYGESYDVQS